MTTQEFVRAEVRRLAVTQRWTLIEDTEWANIGVWRLYNDDIELMGEIAFSFSKHVFTLYYGSHEQRGDSTHYGKHEIDKCFSELHDFFEAEA